MIELVVIIVLSIALMVALVQWVHWKIEARDWEEKYWRDAARSRRDRRAVDAALADAGYVLERDTDETGGK